MKLINIEEKITKCFYKDIRPGEKFKSSGTLSVYTKVVLDPFQFKDYKYYALRDIGLAIRDDGTLCIWTHSPEELEHNIELVTPRSKFSAVIECESEEEYNRVKGNFNINGAK